MNVSSNDDDSDESDFSIAGEDQDVHLNHYRVPRLSNYGQYGLLNNDQQSNGIAGNNRSRANLKQVKFSNEGKIMSLFELAAQKVACHFPFGLVEHYDQPVPEPMQCRIAFWSFPQDEEDVKLYTCLANGNADYFYRAEELLFQNAVRDMLQVGFHLSANVMYMNSETEHLETFRVALTFDRRRITNCSCSCMTSTFWCQHVVAVCLQRIRKPQEAKLRAPVSESLQRLGKNQLQKFAQYLINELPQQILPAAQKLLDELLSGDEALINLNPAAPDPTAGALLNEHTSWCLDYTHLSVDIYRILLKQCTAQPTVCSDIQSLHVTAPPSTTEYSQLLRPIRGREPEGIWNLISIVGEMMKRRDPNLFTLLEIMTNEVMKFEKIITWWLETKVSLHSGSTIHFANTKNSQCTSQYSCSNFCDEIVHLWRLAALNPSSIASERKKLHSKFFDWHLSILKKHTSSAENQANKKFYLELFSGFKPAMEGCQIYWDDWDEKRGEFQDPHRFGSNNNKDKPVKTNKKRKRRSKKQNTTPASTSVVAPVTSPATEAADIQTTAQPSTNAGDDPVSRTGTEQGPGTEEFKTEHSRNDTQKVSDCITQGSSNSIENSNNHVEPNQSGDRENQAEHENVEEASYEPRNGDHNDDNLPVNNEQDEQNQALDGQYNDRDDQERVNNIIDQYEPDLQVYFMNDQPDDHQEQQKPLSLEDLIKLNTRRLNDPHETLYAKIEGLHAHGHLEQARLVARRLASEILSQSNYPSLRQLFTLPRRRKKKGSLDNRMSIVASETLSKINFLCTLLQDDTDNYGLIFKLVMFGVELKRLPAATKPLEVKLISQKQELISLLKTISLQDEELIILKEKAKCICENESQPDPLATLILGSYIFEVLVLSRNLPERSPVDTNLGFQTALSALGAKLNVSEADHPLLCEGIRRQRGELALTLILNYKDDQEKLDAILKQLLDKDLIEPTSSQKQQQQQQKVSNNNNNSAVSTTSNNEPLIQTSAWSLANSLIHGTSAGVACANGNSNANKKAARNQTPIVQDPNQPSEAAAHFMFELAKTVFDKAGGSSTTAHLFRPQLVAPNGTRGIHRKLHMCTLRIALYALGLQNRTSTNWMHRTYNGRASFIHDQALEVGLPAIKFLCENWEGYLTPVEAALVADKAGCSSDQETKRVAADMAKSCLKYANYLDSNAVSRILIQCKEQTIEMVEEACNEIEQVAEHDNVCPDVLFVTARTWFNLYLKLNNTNERYSCNNGNLYQLNNLASAPQPPSTAIIENQASPALHGADPQSPFVDWLAESASVRYPQRLPLATLQLHQPQPPASSPASSIAATPPIVHQLAAPPTPTAVGAIDPTKQTTPAIHYSPLWDDYAKPLDTTTYTHVHFVRAAFRVGIKAMDSMRLPIHLGNKHNPKKLDDILWLLGISKSLGRDCLYKFSRSVIRNIIDPYVLHIIIIEMTNFFQAISLPENDKDRANVLKPILDKCLDRCMKQVKDLVRHTTYEKNYIDTIFEMLQTLCEVTQSEATASCYWEILKFVEYKIDSKRNNRRSRTCAIDTTQRLSWIKRWANDCLNVCFCDECWVARSSGQRFVTLIN